MWRSALRHYQHHGHRFQIHGHWSRTTQIHLSIHGCAVARQSCDNLQANTAHHILGKTLFRTQQNRTRKYLFVVNTIGQMASFAKVQIDMDIVG